MWNRAALSPRHSIMKGIRFEECKCRKFVMEI